MTPPRRSRDRNNEIAAVDALVVADVNDLLLDEDDVAGEYLRWEVLVREEEGEYKLPSLSTDNDEEEEPPPNAKLWWIELNRRVIAYVVSIIDTTASSNSSEADDAFIVCVFVLSEDRQRLSLIVDGGLLFVCDFKF